MGYEQSTYALSLPETYDAACFGAQAAGSILPLATCADPLLLQLLAFAVSGVFPVLVFFGGTLADVGATCVLGLMFGLAEQAYSFHTRIARLSYFLTGLGMGFLARATHAAGIATCTVRDSSAHYSHRSAADDVLSMPSAQLPVAISSMIVMLPGSKDAAPQLHIVF